MEFLFEITILHPLARFYPAGIEPFRFTQTHADSNVQPYYTILALPAVISSYRLLEPALDSEKNMFCIVPVIYRRRRMTR